MNAQAQTLIQEARKVASIEIIDWEIEVTDTVDDGFMDYSADCGGIDGWVHDISIKAANATLFDSAGEAHECQDLSRSELINLIGKHAVELHERTLSEEAGQW